MIQRKADKLIREFLLHDKRSLLVTGARQVGKTLIFLMRYRGARI